MLENNLRENYLEQVEKHEWFEAVLSGKSSLESTLDDILERLVAVEGDDETEEILTEFGSYVNLVHDFSRHAFDQNIPRHKAATIPKTDESYKSALKNAGYYVAGGLLSVIPGVGPIAMLFGVLAGLKFYANGTDTLMSAYWKENPHKAFRKVYDAAIKADESISRAFIIEHFHNARSRFEQTYIALEENEQSEVDHILYEQLEVGAVDMSEHEFNDYLLGLKEGKIPGTVLKRDLRWHNKHGWCAVEYNMTPDEFREEKEAVTMDDMSAELETLLCGWPSDRLTIVEVFGKGRKAVTQIDAYEAELREWYRAQDDEYLREIADRI